MRFLVCVLLALPLSAADLNGVWSATLKTGTRDLPFQLEFSSGAGAYSQRGDFPMALNSVRIAGNAVAFELQIPMGPSAKFEGTVEGDRLTGEMISEVPGLRGQVEAKRTGPPARMPADLAPQRADLAALGDEFDRAETLKSWKNFAEAEGWPNRIETMEIGDGALRIVPRSGAWWAGYHGVYLFKELKGDFVLTTRLKVTGKTGGEPSVMWTISGLLVRAPGARDQPKENWIYLMTGRGPAQARVVDAKSTRDTSNAWDITPALAGWYELRLARIGPLFVALVRPDGAEWTLRKRIFRPDLPETIQAGINVTSDFPLSASMPAAKYNAELFPDRSRPDSFTTFDYVRFAQAKGVEKLAGREILGIADAELLALFR